MFEPLQKKRTSGLITDKVKQSIFSGQYKPGDRLPSERELALQMKVGRPAVREALRTLEASGMIHIKQGGNGGIFVCQPSPNVLTRPLADLFRLNSVSLENLTEAGLIFEKNVLELVMRSYGANDYQHLEALVKSAFRKLRRRERIAEENLLFHTALADMCKNPIVTSVMSALNTFIGAFVKPLHPPLSYERKILEGHRHILEEMKKGDLAKAKDKYDRHVLFFETELKRLARIKNVNLGDTIQAMDHRSVTEPG